MKLAPTPLAFQGRIFFLRVLLILAFFISAAGYYRLQIFHRQRYEELGEKYRIKKRRIKATRGLIHDRHARLLTRNMPTYNLVLLRTEMQESWRAFLPELCELLGEPRALLEKRYANRSQLLSQPVLLKEDIGFEESMRIRRARKRFPGLAIETTEKRSYSDGELFSHVLGYVGEVSPEILASKPGYQVGDIIGRSGVELAYDDLLTGVDGELTVTMNHRGVFSKLSRTIVKPTVPGEDLYLTLDYELQQLAMKAMKGRGGVVVMMDVRNGEILVYLSSPSFDLNLFSGGLSNERWAELLNSPGKPFLNRPIQGTYAPGSVFKLVTALAALKNHKLNPKTKHYCTGEFTFYNHVFHCHNRVGHGWVDLTEALQASCNVYFYNVARDLDIQELADTAFELGFGRRTGIDLVGEKAGLMPTPEWKRNRFGKIWFPGETLSLALGQGNLQATPLQLLRLMAIIATDGRVPTPRLRFEQSPDGASRQVWRTTRRIDSISTDHFRLLKRAMWQVVNQEHGTGSNARVAGYDVCGKTGTAQLVTFHNEQDRKKDIYINAWFAGFAPRDRPEVAVIVLVEQAGAGGDKAAPIAKLLFEAYRVRHPEAPPS